MPSGIDKNVLDTWLLKKKTKKHKCYFSTLDYSSMTLEITGMSENSVLILVFYQLK